MDDQITQIKQTKEFAYRWSNYYGEEDDHVESSCMCYWRMKVHNVFCL